jgi:hypothetical protein
MAGYCFVYVFPCLWEDHCKIGFSSDPLSRIQALHRRWFEFFDLDEGALIEAETVRDARDLELEVRGPLGAHNAPAPMTVRREAAGHTEWFRGASLPLKQTVRLLEKRGHTVHAPLRAWLRSALVARGDRLYAWTLAQWSAAGPYGSDELRLATSVLRDTLDAYAALKIELEPLLPPEVDRWHREHLLGHSPRSRD